MSANKLCVFLLPALLQLRRSLRILLRLRIRPLRSAFTSMP